MTIAYYHSRGNHLEVTIPIMISYQKSPLRSCEFLPTRAVFFVHRNAARGGEGAVTAAERRAAAADRTPGGSGRRGMFGAKRWGGEPRVNEV